MGVTRIFMFLHNAFKRLHTRVYFKTVLCGTGLPLLLDNKILELTCCWQIRCRAIVKLSLREKILLEKEKTLATRIFSFFQQAFLKVFFLRVMKTIPQGYLVQKKLFTCIAPWHGTVCPRVDNFLALIQIT